VDGQLISLSFLQMFYYIRDLIKKLDRNRILTSSDDQISGIMTYFYIRLPISFMDTFVIIFVLVSSTESGTVQN
jgi:hypothetical protein